MSNYDEKSIIVTNNPMVLRHNKKHIIFYDSEHSFGDVLNIVRDNIHAGRKLLTHPLSGSVKPYETPYKTVLLTKGKGPLDTDGLEIIEKSIETAKKFEKNKREIPKRVLEDFQLIDFDLIREFII